MKKNHLYDVWSSMKRRCENPHMQNYAYYGAKGIKVCGSWHDFQSFKKWSENNGYQDGLSIDRIDSTKDYEPSNCQWIDLRDNVRNAKETIISVDGVEGNLSAWARFLGASKDTVSYHLNGLGKPIDMWIRQRAQKMIHEQELASSQELTA